MKNIKNKRWDIWIIVSITVLLLGFAFYKQFDYYRLLCLSPNIEIVEAKVTGITHSGQAGKYVDYEYEVNGVIYKSHSLTRRNEKDIPKKEAVLYNIGNPLISTLVSCTNNNFKHTKQDCKYELGFWMYY